MTESLTIPTPKSSLATRREPWRNFAAASPRSMPLPNLKPKGDLQTRLCTCTRLDWEDLQCFEVVNYQFQSWGVTFTNAIALRPSNAAYPAYSGEMVVMGAPKDGWLEATFSRPVQFVSGFITSSRRTILTAFDSGDRVVATVESAGVNLNNASSCHAPNAYLSLSASNIHRVTFEAFNGHLTLDDFCFGSH